MPAVRLCLGPMSINFATPGAAPVLLEFAPDHPCQGFAGLVEIHLKARHRIPGSIVRHAEHRPWH